MDSDNKTTVPTLQKPLRLWPGVVIVILQWLVRFGIPAVLPGNTSTQIGVFGGLLAGLAIVVWWAFFSRAPRSDRWIAIVLMIVSLVATFQFIHISIETAMMGLMFIVYSVPVLSLAFIAWALVSHRFSSGYRRATMVTTIIFSSVFWVFLRTDGMDGESHQDFKWRWAKSAEDRLIGQNEDKQMQMPSEPAPIAAEAEWPGFRGLHRDGVIHGERIATDWSESPPVEMWRRSVGPGCSSFAIHGTLLYTQEQRGEYELVTCYNLNTGKPVWRHSDKTRFWDSHTGAGPRSTPTLSKGHVFTLGATGILNVLDERDGNVVWSRNAALDTDVKLPGWGFTSSPLVVDSVVLVAIAGKLLAYDLVTGNQLWSSPDGGESYSSPHLLTSEGVKQVLFINKTGVASYAPADGKVLWDMKCEGNHIVQPAIITDSDIIIDEGDVKGMKRIAIKKGSMGITAEEQWTSNMLKPNFNDFVVHKGYVYGFEGPALVCIDIAKGDRKWRGGRYGGQLLLLADQDMLLVMSERGELALVMSTPEQFREIARFPAIKGRTWNHPALAGNVLLVRNSLEMAAFRLPSAQD